MNILGGTPELSTRMIFNICMANVLLNHKGPYLVKADGSHIGRWQIAYFSLNNECNWNGRYHSTKASTIIFIKISEFSEDTPRIWWELRRLCSHESQKLPCMGYNGMRKPTRKATWQTYKTYLDESRSCSSQWHIESCSGNHGEPYWQIQQICS